MSARRSGPGGASLALASLAFALSACAVRPYNEPLPDTGPTKAYTFADRLPRNSPKLFVVLTFSGGGTRAAAFTLGVLEKLAATTIMVDGNPRRLLDEVDVITFTQMQFDYLCSDLSEYPVARAVMASATVPILFAPITLRNHPGRCPGRSPAWVAQALADRNPADRKFHAAMALASYEDADAVPWVRLVDGGIIDNLGVRGSIMSEVNHHGRVLEMAGAFSPQALAEVEQVLVIASNTQAISGREWLRSADDPGLLDTAEAIADATNHLLSAETTLLAQQGFDMWAAHVNAGRCESCPKVSVDFAVLSFDHLADAAERERFRTTPTAFRLERATVDALRALPARMLEGSPQFRSFLDRVQ